MRVTRRYLGSTTVQLRDFCDASQVETSVTVFSFLFLEALGELFQDRRNIVIKSVKMLETLTPVIALHFQDKVPARH